MDYNDLENITDADIQSFREFFFQKPEFELVKRELKNIKNGGVRVYNIDRYYTFDLRCDVFANRRNALSINQVFNNKSILEIYIKNGMKLYQKYINPKKDFYYNLTGALLWMFRIYPMWGKYHCLLPSRFSIKTARTIYEKYNANNVIYDPCAGWGDRMLAALSMNMDYIATDTNEELVNRLNKLGDDYNSVNGVQLKHNVICQPAEQFIPELENKVGLAFTSPPYFDLEVYKGDKTSTKLYNEYDLWKQQFLRKMLDNSYKYIINGGYICINIKNSKEHKLYDDTVEILKENPGLKFICDEKVKVKRYTKQIINKGNDYMDEKCCVFQKIN